MTILSDVVQRKNAKNCHFWAFPEKFGTEIGPNSLNSMLGVLHDVRDQKNKNHDGGAIMGYLKVPKKGP